ncbi:MULTISPECIES: DUF927 domain-containing protein [unclassified Streptomyces]|uniref:DUF927 domain-containing protein n=1 Tax=unclassified Streptomyces TaxID=2593676 RepID=UPI00224CF5F9|nr:MULTISPECIES: DUF927 domain-containing protein [unclassified Streptomyces]MCX4871106.1 DUF927 domain-containing protein [Streptomyces sp. NBC_00906]MCX4902728.1 DUF927 domain-containing protein [Streptomyces sp. NBC_00892]
MKRGWYYRSADRMILHRQNPEDTPLSIGQVPKITAQIVHLTDDGEDIKTEYLAKGKRQRRGRILTEDELDRGTWSAKLGVRRPTGNDERHAYARLIREEGDAAPITSARTYYNDDGDLIFPDADAQLLGYRVLRGDEEAAREAWDEQSAWLAQDGKSALIAGGYFAGPVMESLEMLAHMISMHGPGQQGKSTLLVFCAALMGDVKPKRQKLWMTWNASKQGITQDLRLRGYLPLGLDEHSSSGKTIKESSREISQMVAGAMRAMGTADGSPRESDGFWHSVILSSSNEPLKFEGQTEDLATRLQEFKAPFFPDVMLDAEGAPAKAGHKGAEHVSKRIKRLAAAYGGWPLEWAIQKDMFRAENLAQLKKLHLELCAKYRPAQGGVAATIAELHMAWVVGAHMLGEAIGFPGLGKVAEKEAAARLAEAIEISAEANVPDCERLWNALDSLRIETAVFPEMNEVLKVAEEGFRRPRGFHRSEEGEWWVIDPVVRETAAQIGIDNLTAALRALDDLGVHERGTGKNSQKLLPKLVRGKIGSRMHCFKTARAEELFAQDENESPKKGGDEEFPGGTTPGNDPERPGVVPENGPLTSEGTTGTTGTTPELVLFKVERGATSGTTPEIVVPPMPSEAPAVVFPPARMYQTGDERLDAAWLRLEAKAKGRTRGAVSFGMLGDGYLYLPNHEPVAVPMPGNVDQVPDLMASYGLQTLWVHESAALGMGLPTYDERMPEDLAEYRGPQGPTPHSWATPRPESDLVVQGEGISCWMTLKTQGGAGARLSVALPMYDDRFDRSDEPGRGGFGAAATPEILLDAYMVYLLSTLHGSPDNPQVIPYYLSPNTTAQDFAGSAKGSVVSAMVRGREVPPVEAKIRPLVNMQWTRPVEEITEAERACGWIHQYDKNAAWLAAFGSVWLGVGDPTHYAEGRAYETNKAGYWRVRELPGLSLEGLPELNIEPAEEGGYWLRTPGVDLLIEKFDGWVPDVVEAWVWENSKRALYGMYDRLRLCRKRILASAEEGRPGARYAKQVSGMLYQSFRGYLSRREPKKDHTTGLPYEKDIYWRPDWAQMILDLALANTYRNLAAFAASGHHPLSLRVDAVTYASDTSDPVAAKPDAMELGTGGGDWKPEYSVPAGELLPVLDEVKKMAKAMHLHHSRQKGQS